MSDKISIAIGGDIFANGRFYDDDRPISPTFEDVTAITGAADVLFANYEMPLSTRGQPIEKLANIRADPAIAPDIGRLGLDVVSLANNHMMDYGPEAMADTIACLDAQGIAHVGAGPTIAQAAEPVIVDIRGRTIGFLAFTCLVAPGAGASDHNRAWRDPRPVRMQRSTRTGRLRSPGSRRWSRSGLFADARAIEKLSPRSACEALRKGESNVLCLSLHWGYGGLSSRIAEISAATRAREPIDAGADIILGNHVHAVQRCRVVSRQGDPLQPRDVRRAPVAARIRGGRDHRARALPVGRHVAGRLRDRYRAR